MTELKTSVGKLRLASFPSMEAAGRAETAVVLESPCVTSCILRQFFSIPTTVILNLIGGTSPCLGQRDN